jgi:hypothetical protein
MVAGIIAGLSNAVLWGVQKVVSEEFFKAVLVQVVKYVGPKLAKQSTNKLDDKIVDEIIKRLES